MDEQKYGTEKEVAMKLRARGYKPVWHVSFLYADGSVGWLEVRGTWTQLERKLMSWEPTHGYTWPLALSVVKAL